MIAVTVQGFSLSLRQGSLFPCPELYLCGLRGWTATGAPAGARSRRIDVSPSSSRRSTRSKATASRHAPSRPGSVWSASTSGTRIISCTGGVCRTGTSASSRSGTSGCTRWTTFGMIFLSDGCLRRRSSALSNMGTQNVDLLLTRVGANANAAPEGGA